MIILGIIEFHGNQFHQSRQISEDYGNPILKFGLERIMSTYYLFGKKFNSLGRTITRTSQRIYSKYIKVDSLLSNPSGRNG